MEELQTVRDRDQSLKNIVTLVYALQALAYFTGGLAALAAVIVAYVKRDDVRGTIFESHVEWQIGTFWIGLGLAVLGGLTFWFGLGFIIWGVAAIWILYRIIKGWLALNDGKAVA